MATASETRAAELAEALAAIYRSEDGWSALDVTAAGSAAIRVVGIFRGELTAFVLPTARSNVARLTEWASRSLDAHAEAFAPPLEDEEGLVEAERGPVEVKLRSISVEPRDGRVILTVPGPEASVLAIADAPPADALTFMDRVFKAARVAMRSH